MAVENKENQWQFAGSIELTSFVIARQFSEDSKGTKITSHTPEGFAIELQERIQNPVRVKDGYAPFCKIVFVENFTDAKLGDVEITPENTSQIQSDYVARRPGELPVLTRWIGGVEAPVAKYLGVVFYDKAQLQKEYDNGPKDGEKPPGADWGVVLIMGVAEPEETPMNPMTMMRNALGVEHGGSGVPLDAEAYKKSVEYWKNHVLVQE